MRNLTASTLLLLLIAGLGLAGCETTSTPATGGDSKTTASAPSGEAAKTPETTPPADEQTKTTADANQGLVGSATDPKLPKSAAPGAQAPKAGDEIVILETDEGKIALRFFPSKAPEHVKSFISLAKKGFFDGTRFHRTIPGFVIQGGDPNSKTDDRGSWGTGGPGYSIKGEMNDLKHTRGILSMARTQDPDSAGSQFFITVAETPSLDANLDSAGKPVPGAEGYTVFGHVILGMDVVDKIVARPTGGPTGDQPENPVKIKKARVVKWPVDLAKA